MPKKSTKKKAPNPRKVDWSDEQYFDPNRSIIYIEHSEDCPIFKEIAIEFQFFLQQRYPDRKFILNRNQYGKLKPRKGAFEINLCETARTSKHLLWSGVNKGPTHHHKFPRTWDELLPNIVDILKKEPAKLKLPEKDKHYNYEKGESGSSSSSSSTSSSSTSSSD